MKNARMALVAAFIALISSAVAQSFGGSLLYEPKARTWSPVVSIQAFKLEGFKLKGFDAEFRILGGIEEARGLVAGAVVLSYPVARQLSFEVGGAVRVLSDRRPSFGLVLGASFKF